MVPLTRLTLMFLASAALASPALADDDDDWLFEEEEDEEEDQEEEPRDEEEEEGERPPTRDEGDLDFDEDDFDEDTQVGQRGTGEDNAGIYRAYLAELEGLSPDEEALAWERYLKKYPKSVFLSRITERMAELEQAMFDERIDGPGGPGSGDAGQAELHFAQPMTLENIDPISKIRGGFELGLPDYFGLLADAEFQLARQLSVHAGVRGRYTGWSAEAGARYALVKSARTRTLVTAIGDFRLGANPFFPALRPQLGVGQRLNLGESIIVDVQAQAGSDLAFVASTDGETMFDPRLVGGANVTIEPAPRVKVYFETSTYMKDLGWSDNGAFRFNAFAFGIKFIGRKSNDEMQYEIGAGAQAPYAVNYWGYHLGAINADVNYYLDR